MMSYGAAAIVMFFSVAGAFEAGSKLIYYLEASFWSFLSDFQKKEKYISMIDDEEGGLEFKVWMEGYAFDTGVLMLVQFWHVFFILGIGIGSAFLDL